MRPARQVFLLSPAYCGGRRANILLKPESTLPLAVRLREGRLSLGEAFSFMSGLYFRGKLTYATVFGRPAEGDNAVLIITPTRGLQRPDVLIGSDIIREFAAVDVDAADDRYRAPLERDLTRLVAHLPADGRVVLLGSVATGKYVDVLAAALGRRLYYPPTFIGRGDMSRGGVLLRSAADGIELDTPCSTRRRHGGVRGPRSSSGGACQSAVEAETQFQERAREVRRSMMRVEPAGIRQHPQPRALELLRLLAERRTRPVERRSIRHHSHDGDNAWAKASHLARQLLPAGAKFSGIELVGGRCRARDEIRDAAAERKELAALAGGEEPRSEARCEKRGPEAVSRPREVMSGRA